MSYLESDYDLFLNRKPQYDSLLRGTQTLYNMNQGAGGSFQPYDVADKMGSNDTPITAPIETTTIHIGEIGNSAIRVDDAGNIWLGNSLFANAPFSVTSAGVVKATSGTIAGWQLSSSYFTGGNAVLHKDGYMLLGTGNDIVRVDASDADYRIWIGNTVAASAPFRVSKTGVLTATDVNLTGVITASSGDIGGWTINANSIADNSVEADANILLDSVNGLIRVGNTSASYIKIDGVNKYIRSSNYVSGITGSGFTLQPDLLEVGNIRARGKFTSTVFEKESVSAIGGNLFMTKDADVLNADMTALDTSTMTIAGSVIFAIGDFLRIKDTVNDEWFEVTNVNSAPIYTVTRDKASAYAADTNPAWKKGMAVLNYGQSGAGMILMTTGSVNSPRMDIATHAGVPWTTQTTRVRIGNLNGFLDYSSDLYGIAIGDSSNYLKYDPTNGLRLKSTNSIIDVGIQGYVLGGQTDYETGTGFFLGYNAGNYKFSIGSATEYLKWNGTTLITKGGFIASSPINLANYSTANLPEPIGDTGFHSPSSS